MSNAEADVGSVALASALARARRRAGPASVAAALVPLALATISAYSPAHATISIECGGSSHPACTIDGSGGASTVTPGTGGVTNYNYVFHNTGNTTITEIVLPEVQANVFINPAVDGWTVTQTSTPNITAPTFKAGTPTPADYLEISGGALAPSSSLDFTLTSDISTSIPSNATIKNNLGSVTSIDPPTPDPIPEPTSLALLGVAAAGVFAARRKRG